MATLFVQTDIRGTHRPSEFKILVETSYYNSCTRWLPKLLGYDYRIEYKKGSTNAAADSLSRKVEFQFLAINMPHADWWSMLQNEVGQDPFYNSLRCNPSFQLRDGIW